MYSSEYAIYTKNLTKTFTRQQEKRTAVYDIDLAIPNGELFGLLGPNGAGKTTLVKMLCTLISPTSGQAIVAGHGIEQSSAIRASVGLVVADERSFYWRLTARQNLQFYAAMHNFWGGEAKRRVDEALDSVQLLDRADSVFQTFSTGMKQRLAIARGLLHRPKLLFLDEPTRSLDPYSTDQLHLLIRHLIDLRGMTVFLITHDLVEAEKLCNRVAIMDKGTILATGNADQLRQRLQPVRHYRMKLSDHSAELLPALHSVATQITLDHNILQFTLPDQPNALPPVLDCLRHHAINIDTIESTQPSLEMLFNQLISR